MDDFSHQTSGHELIRGFLTACVILVTVLPHHIDQ